MKLFFLSCCFLSILFLNGCSSYNTLKHDSFSLSLPEWEQQELLHSLSGVPTGLFASDGVCALNFSLSHNSHLAVARPYLVYLHSLKPSGVIDQTIDDAQILVTYALPPPEERRGKLKLITCPNTYTYFVDFSCPSAIYTKRTTEISTVLDSMRC